MTTTAQVVEYLDEILETASTPDYPGAVNGLQLANRGQVRRIAASVDFSSRTVTAAAGEEADLLLVHHGMFWSGVRPLTGPAYDQLKLLLDNDIAVYSSHLPLDRHPSFGNNVLLSEELGLSASGDFGKFGDISVGIRGDADIPTASLVARAGEFAKRHGGSVIASAFAPHRRTLQWAICTGAGANAETLDEARRNGIDTLIVGEGPHWTSVAAEDAGIAVIYAGHYATETLGVRALAEHLADRFRLEWTMIDAPTGL